MVAKGGGLIPPLICISRESGGRDDHIRNGVNASIEHPVRARFVGVLMVLAGLVGYTLGLVGRVLLALDPMFLLPGLIKWAGFKVELFPVEEIAVVYYPSGYQLGASAPATVEQYAALERMSSEIALVPTLDNVPCRGCFKLESELTAAQIKIVETERIADKMASVLADIQGDR